jgi:hypothetical protein
MIVYPRTYHAAEAYATHQPWWGLSRQLNKVARVPWAYPGAWAILPGFPLMPIRFARLNCVINSGKDLRTQDKLVAPFQTGHFMFHQWKK